MADSSRLSRKLQSLLEMPTESPELVNALDLLGGMYGANTADARRGLRGLLETEHLDINQRLIDAFAPAQAQLAAVTAQVEALTRSCDEIGSSIAAAKSQTHSLLGESERLAQDRQRLEVRQDVVGRFLEHFQLSAPEEQALARGEVDAAFLAALARLAKIRADCGQLLRTRHQRAALELMDVMGAHQEAAFEQLYRWVQTAVKDLSDDDAEGGEGSHYLAKAIVALRQRPVLFKYCVEEMGKSRRQTILNSFICALTQGGPNGLPRPIELSAAEPLRYVGDMASWLHQALANEAEMLRGVLGEAAELEHKATPQNSPRKADGDGTQAAAEAAAEAQAASELWQRVLGSAFQSVCRPFKLRVEQALNTGGEGSNSSGGGGGAGGGTDGVLSYQLANLLAFYAETIEQMLPGSELAATMRQAEQQCSASVFEKWTAQNDLLLASPPSCPPDLGISPAIETAASRLSAVCDACSESLVSARQTDQAFAPILAAALDAPLRVCYLSGANAQLDESSLTIFLINNLARIEGSLRPYRQSFTSQRMEEVAAQMSANVDQLVSAQVSHILAACGLATQYRAMQAHARDAAAAAGGGGLASISGCSEAEMGEAFRVFYSQLFSSADDDAAGGSASGGGGGSGKIFEACAKIQPPRLREEARSSIVKATLDCYSEIYSAVHEPSNGYKQPATLAPHGPDAVRMVLE